MHLRLRLLETFSPPWAPQLRARSEWGGSRGPPPVGSHSCQEELLISIQPAAPRPPLSSPPPSPTPAPSLSPPTPSGVHPGAKASPIMHGYMNNRDILIREDVIRAHSEGVCVRVYVCASIPAHSHNTVPPLSPPLTRYCKHSTKERSSLAVLALERLLALHA